MNGGTKTRVRVQTASNAEVIDGVPAGPTNRRRRRRRRRRGSHDPKKPSRTQR
jgi:hypothetical protein